MNLDRFRPPTTDFPKVWSRCYACNEPIYIGDEYIRHYGRVCCDHRSCIIKTTECEIIIAGEDETE